MIMIRRSCVIMAMSVGLIATALGSIGGSASAATSGQSSSVATGEPSPESAAAQLSADTVPGAPYVRMAGSPQLTFAGYQWTVKNSTSPIGPGPNLFDANGPYVDASGVLHLRILKTAAGWESSEVILNPTLGYGTYRWTVHGPVSTLNPDVVLGIFTYDSVETPPGNGELDFEASRFADPGERTDAQYVVQPNAHPGNRVRIILPNPDITTIMMTWLPGSVTFSADSLPKWKNSSSWVPTNSTEQVHMNLYLFRGVPPSNGQPVAVRVSNFQFSAAKPTTSIPKASGGAMQSETTVCGASARSAASLEFRLLACRFRS
jgi:hypothetical protein